MVAEGGFNSRCISVGFTELWLLTTTHRYAIGDLHNLRTTSQSTASPLATVSATVSGVLGVAAATFVVLTGDPTGLMIGPLLAGVPLSVALVSWRMRRRFHSLYADYAGRTEQIVGDQDERRFNQICRALLRAREYGRDRAY
jgi:hypothetical protein